MTIEIIVVVLGAIISMIAAVAVYAFKVSMEHLSERDRTKTLEKVRRRITEIGLNVAGISLVHTIDQSDEPKFELTNELLREIEEEIALRVSGKVGKSADDATGEVDRRMDEIRDRISKIEKRFPDRDTVDKISSINDALFAERIEQLSARLDTIEKRMLTKWDVVIIVAASVGAIFAVVSATWAALLATGLVG